MSMNAKRFAHVLSAVAVAALLPLALLGYERVQGIDADRMLDVSVSIRTASPVHTDQVGDSVWEPGQGSGFLVSAETCEVWTNHHVVEGAAFIEVFPRGWSADEGIAGEVVASTPRADFAILRMAHCEGLPAAHLGDSSTVRPGDASFVVGNPLGRNPDSITRGIISHVRRYVSGATPFLQTDAAINPGNSGGALFNEAGEVIGVSTAIASVKGVNAGIGYAVPVNVLRRQALRLKHGTPSFGDAGISDRITDLTTDQARLMRVPQGHAAVVVVKAPEKAPALGAIEAHDVIYRIGGKALRDAEHAKDIIVDHDSGDTLELDIVRAGTPMKVELTLAEGWTESAAPEPEPYDGLLGMDLEMWNEHEDERGVFKTPVITRVQSLGPAHRAKIMSSQKTLVFGDGVIRPHMLDVKTVTGVVVDGIFEPVTRVDEIERAARRAHAAGQALLLEVALWSRSNPMDRTAELEHMATRYFTLEPRSSGASDASDALPMAATAPALLL